MTFIPINKFLALLKKPAGFVLFVCLLIDAYLFAPAFLSPQADLCPRCLVMLLMLLETTTPTLLLTIFLEV